MRLVRFSSRRRRRTLAVGCITVAALYCVNVPLSTPELAENTNLWLWACGSTAALALAYLKRSQQ
jgi:hypothetical protein